MSNHAGPPPEVSHSSHAFAAAAEEYEAPNPPPAPAPPAAAAAAAAAAAESVTGFPTTRAGVGSLSAWKRGSSVQSRAAQRTSFLSAAASALTRRRLLP